VGTREVADLNNLGNLSLGFSGGSILMPPNNGVAYSLYLPEKTGTFAVTSDIVPTVTNYLSTNNVLISALTITNGLTGLNSLTVNGDISATGLRITLNEGAAKGEYSFAVNSGNALGEHSFAEGEDTVAASDSSHTEGFNTVAGSRVTFVNYLSNTKTFTFTSTTSGLFSYVVPGTFLHVKTSSPLVYSLVKVASRDVTTGEITIEEDVFKQDVTTGTRDIIARAGSFAHAEGALTNAEGNYAHAEGFSNTASGSSSHVEGYSNTASGAWSHAEGEGNTASGSASHAKNQFNIASGTASYAYGHYNRAIGIASVAGGRAAEAAHDRTWVWRGSGAVGTPRLSSTRTDQFMVSAAGGTVFYGAVGINTDSQDNALTVVGTINASSLALSLTAAPPSDTVNPVAWTDIVVNGATYKLPLYQ
jgi:hypothetical protein